MRTFIIIFAIVSVLVIVYFIIADYNSRKEAEILQGGGDKKKLTALDWVTGLFPVVFGSAEKLIRKKKRPEDKEDQKELAPSYEDLVKEGDLVPIG